MKNKIMKDLMFIFQCMFVLAMVWIFILTIKRTALEIPMAFLLFIGFTAAIAIWMLKEKSFAPMEGHKLFPIIWLISFVVMLILAFNLKVDMYNNWDYGKVLRSAYEWVTEGKITAFEYYIRYPNNQFLLLLLSIIIKIILSVVPSADIYFCQDITIIINILMIQLAIGLTHVIAGRMLDRKSLLLSDLFVAGCSPLYLYASMLYTDTAALLPLMLLIYCLIAGEEKLQKNQMKHAVLYFFVGGMIAAVGYYVKLTIIFFCIGFLIYVFLKWPWKRWLICVLCMAAGFLIAYTGTKKMITLQSDYTAEQYDTYQFPYVHWVMMSLGPNGRYNQDDVDYTLSFNSMDAKKQADMKVIQERVNDMGLTGLLEHGLYEKVYHAWTQGALSADDYVHRQPLSTGIIRQIFALDGKYYKGYLLYAQAYWLLIISGMILSAVRYFKNREMCQIHGIEITIFGLFVFLLLWESNPRYLMHFLLMFCIVSAYGYGIIRKTKQGKQNSEKLPN